MSPPLFINIDRFAMSLWSQFELAFVVSVVVSDLRTGVGSCLLLCHSELVQSGAPLDLRPLENLLVLMSPDKFCFLLYLCIESYCFFKKVSLVL